MSESEPRPPRRLFLAAGLAALLAAGGTGLVTWGAISSPETETFRFTRGTALATGEETRLRGFLVPAIRDDRLAVVIVGHTGTQGEPAANLALSESRAEAARAIAVSAGIPTERITVTGVGGGAPLPREPGQSERAHEAELARVEITLQVRR